MAAAPGPAIPPGTPARGRSILSASGATDCAIAFDVTPFGPGEHAGTFRSVAIRRANPAKGDRIDPDARRPPLPAAG